MAEKLPRRTLVRGPLQYLLGALALAYAGLGWHYADAMVRLVSMEVVAGSAFWLAFLGSASLLAGAARHVYNAQKGTYFLLFAALVLGYAALSIGNWDYLIGKTLAAGLAFGALVAGLGAWLAYRARP
jgi:drug/metabolite transporter (DMT)-like permease